MDRPLDSNTRRIMLIKRIASVALPLVALVLLVTALSGWLRPSVRRDRIRTARVERGDIEASIEGSGKVVPETEHVITSPIDTRVKEVLLKPGARVEPGDPILLLDVAASTLEVKKLEDRVALKRNEAERERIGLEQTLSELHGRRDIKALERESLQFELAQDRRLHGLGLLSDEALHRAETDEKRVAIELRQLVQSMGQAERATRAALEGLALELSILDKDREEAASRLEQAAAVADRGGILTGVISENGVSVRRGDELARIADLSSFRVEASLSDVHAGRVRPGLRTRVRVGDELLAGEVRSVRPTVENGILVFEVALDEGSHPALRHNLRVDVHVVTERKTGVLRVKRGPFASHEGSRQVFVVRGDRALRTPVELGLSNFESYEVLSGLAEGDEVIVSDMSDSLHVKEVKLK